LKDYQSTADSLQNAVTWGTVDDHAASRLQAAQQILSLDPSTQGLPPAERYRRSVYLLQQTLDLVKGCKGALGLSMLQMRATSQLNQNRPENTESVAENISLSVDLWKTNQKSCGTPAPAALTLLMPLLAK
jgi:hypothetical protein